MAVGYAIAKNVAGDLGTLATAIAAKPNISAAVDSDTVEVDNRVTLIKVTGTAVTDVAAAIRPDYAVVDHGGATSGTYTLTVDGQTTASIAYNAAASAVKSALELLSTVTTVTVTGTGTIADPWVVVFAESEQSRVVTGTGSLTGGTGLRVRTPVANVTSFPGTTIA